ncbi:ABC transporter permease [Bifidobacterium sp.]|jgi:osmoprotectant transport system permease protein|uniref:ABC transporter permease n=1 Tax=Bifidobacterium sp. TaxID=41200 RepID=UPI0025B9CC67|nr:ABC transporter permease subunit [Bifidobacterium sp.]MCH4208966.1 ABC transporter permease subunit [Bifidobacterium sp.]MCI1224951.1 ABC transporter permease subunit [Bifidobacterium sp.]
MTWALNNLALILSLTVEHLQQSLIAIVFGFALSLPLGWAAWRVRRLRSTILTATGVLYTIPSLALLLILPVAFGYPATSEINLVVALTMYAIAIMVRAVVEGLDSVDASARAAATALGYGSARRFWTVDLPLAGPVILAGVRVAAVSTISLATVGILVGVTNLGYLFTDGLQRRIIAEVLAGIVAVAAIAVVIDLALLFVGRLVMPWTHSSSARTHRHNSVPRTLQTSQSSRTLAAAPAASEEA